MEYKEFIERMKSEVIKKVQPEVSVVIHTAVKNNRTARAGLRLTCPGIKFSPTFYLEEFYEQYQEGVSIDRLTEKLMSLYENLKAQMNVSYEEVLDYERIKDKICFRLIGMEKNQELLSQIPHQVCMDLALVYDVLLECGSMGESLLLITNENLTGWNVSAEELREAASQNTPELLPVLFEQLTDYLYVLTNSRRRQGAAAIFYSNVLRQVYEILGESFYLLPSSIHEMLIVRESYGVDAYHLKLMVEEVNRTDVKEEEVLSDTVYYYRAIENRVVKADIL